MGFEEVHKMDITGDGVDETVGVRRNEDGSVEYHVDVDGDGTADMLAVDKDGDGVIDHVLIDNDGDGKYDTAIVDVDGDGQVDGSTDQ
ncbi:hypothetical protein K3N28_14320 [Glycomyces sp. TRM65418]|uniref:hypothetical protein n=1 Tax=Glycomyces sp. TRM65418 TaxID=2867006 RepID=UPI001CE69AA2|nr:hypothetical protein [Glycomyces sp. TRM65418]MCC3764239.1 hypothetical protein [Glycomyces sp. TRM65418]QZD53922.1 hypothetical protein K3N28_14255 [Glycomyces sp. TRM65418]